MELFDVYSLYPVEPVRGSGSYVYDAAGTEYLDLYGGHAVISIGHTHPHYVEMISSQLSKIGCPIRGDLKYGARRSNPDGGISLHSRRVEFEHPVRREPLSVTAPVPAGDNLWTYFENL